MLNGTALRGVSCVALAALIAACGGDPPRPATGPALPFRTNGEMAVEHAPAPHVVVNLTRSGQLYFEAYEFDLASGDPDEWDGAIQALQDVARAAAGPGPREAPGPRQCRVLVHVDRGVPARHLAWVIEALRHPDLDTEITFRDRRPRAQGGGG